MRTGTFLLTGLILFIAATGWAQMTVRNTYNHVVMNVDEHANVRIGSAQQTGDLTTDNMVINTGLTFAPSDATAGRVLKTNNAGEAYWGVENQRLQLNGQGNAIEITDGMGNVLDDVTLPIIPGYWQLAGTAGETLSPLSNSHKVGIGTTSANAHLEIVSDDYTALRLEGKAGVDEVTTLVAGNGNTRLHSTGAMVFFLDSDNDSGGNGQLTIFAHDDEIWRYCKTLVLDWRGRSPVDPLSDPGQWRPLHGRRRLGGWIQPGVQGKYSGSLSRGCQSNVDRIESGDV